MANKCGDCRFYEPLKIEVRLDGICRRFPRRGLDLNMTRAAEWCGEWRGVEPEQKSGQERGAKHPEKGQKHG